MLGKRDLQLANEQFQVILDAVPSRIGKLPTAPQNANWIARFGRGVPEASDTIC